MGMTNKQFQGLLRFIISYVKRIREDHPDDENIKELYDILQSMIEDA